MRFRPAYLMILFSLLCLRPAIAKAQKSVAETERKIGRVAFVAGTQTVIFGAGLYTLGIVWYSDHDREKFHFYNDNAGWLQLDKAGHAYSSYHVNFMSYKLYRWAGLRKGPSLIYAGLATTVYMGSIEYFDGIFEGYGFSIGDVAANTTGILLSGIQEALWDEQRIRLKFSYSPDPIADYKPYYSDNTPIQRIFTDYNGQTYWLSFNVQKLTGFDSWPSWLNVATGYGATGMLDDYYNPSSYRGRPLPNIDRTRQFYLSPDIDFSQVFKSKRSSVKTLVYVLNLVKFPAPAVEYNGRGFRGRWLFF